MTTGMFLENALITGALVVALGFFIKTWINGLKSAIAEIKTELAKKVDIVACDKAHKLVDRIAHSHGSLGAAGEVISHRGES